MENCKKMFKEVPEDIFNLNDASDTRFDESELIGGVFSDCKSAWMALGGILQVFYIDSAEIRSIWCFGTSTKEQNAQIVCIEELKFPLIIVGLKYGLHNGMVCIYNISCAKILHAIQIPAEITSLHIISNGFDSVSFPGVLSSFSGILSVGTCGGSVFILDLGVNTMKESQKVGKIHEIHDESNPYQLLILTIDNMTELQRHKLQAERQESRLAILLNERETCGQYFELKAPNGRNVTLASKEEVTVSRLHYGSQLCSLIVGYNFGSLQIWDILSMRLIFTSPVYEEQIPVAFIAIQEPIDDPRAYCYFWAVYSCSGKLHNSFPMAALYALHYERKEYHENFGYLYENLQSCSVRFQTNLQLNDSLACQLPQSAECIRLQTFHKSVNIPQDERYTLCMMSWNVFCEEHKVHTYLSLFDLNQWYKEEMPRDPSHYHNYMNIVNVTNPTSLENYVLDVAVKPGSLHSFVGVQDAEEYYRPSALSFHVTVMSSIETCRFVNLSEQKQFFRSLDESGPLALSKPESLYNAMMSAGLSPIFNDLQTTESALQRDILLSSALEHRKLQWLCKCATSWGNGSHRSSGLSLEFLLNWAWERTRVLKNNADRLCTSLFDYSGVMLDRNVKGVLISCRGQFAALRDLYKFIINHCETFLMHADIARQQHDWLQRNYEYFNVIGWMVNLNLLPETKEKYPFEVMQSNYEQRRNFLRLQIIDSDCKHYLLIDQMTEKYPYSTLQSLLRSYFNTDLDIKTVHMIVAYTLLDLQQNFNANIATAMIKFPQIFDLSMSETKAVQSFWQFDHGQIAPAIKQLANTMIRFDDIGEERHKLIIALLKLQKEFQLALIYLKARYVKGCTEDVKNSIQLHVRNNLLFEAVCICRRYGEDSLLEAFFIECCKTGVFMDIVKINFTKEEEQLLLQYMQTHNFAKREDFKAMYYIRRGRYLDFYLNLDKNAPKNIMCNMARKSLDGMLPSITRNVISTCVELKNFECKDTKLMSNFMCDPQERARFNNDFLKATIVNCKQTWTRSRFVSEDNFPLVRPPFPTQRSQVKNIVFPKKVAHITRCIPERNEDVDIEQCAKRRRLSGDDLHMTTIQTMHVHRNENVVQQNLVDVATPQSILKTPSFSDRAKSTTSDDNLTTCSNRGNTPISYRRPAIGASSVRFSGVSNSSESVCSSDLMKETNNLLEHHSNAKRKRNAGEEEENIPVLRSSNFNNSKSSANQLFESFRHLSYAAEELPSPIDEEESVKIPDESRKSSVFVFTGCDELDLPTNLLPRARSTYQKSKPEQIPRSGSLNRIVVDVNVSKLPKESERYLEKENIAKEEGSSSWRREVTLVEEDLLSEPSQNVENVQNEHCGEMEVDQSDDNVEIKNYVALNSKNVSTSSTSYNTAELSSTSEVKELDQALNVSPKVAPTNVDLQLINIEESSEDEIATDSSLGDKNRKRESGFRMSFLKDPDWVDHFKDSPAKPREKTPPVKWVRSYVSGAETPTETNTATADDSPVPELEEKNEKRKSGFRMSFLKNPNWVDHFAHTPSKPKERPPIKWVTSYVSGTETPPETNPAAADDSSVPELEEKNQKRKKDPDLVDYFKDSPAKPQEKTPPVKWLRSYVSGAETPTETNTATADDSPVPELEEKNEKRKSGFRMSFLKDPNWVDHFAHTPSKPKERPPIKWVTSYVSGAETPPETNNAAADDSSLSELGDKNPKRKSGFRMSFLKDPNWVDHFAHTPAKPREKTPPVKWVRSYVSGAETPPKTIPVSADNSSRETPSSKIVVESNVSGAKTPPETNPDTTDEKSEPLIPQISLLDKSSNESPNKADKKAVEQESATFNENVDIYEDLTNTDDQEDRVSNKSDADLNVAMVDEDQEEVWVRTIHHQDSRCVVNVPRKVTLGDGEEQSDSVSGCSSEVFERGFIADTENESGPDLTDSQRDILNVNVFSPALATIQEDLEMPSRRRRSKSMLSNVETPRRRSMRLLQSPKLCEDTVGTLKAKQVPRTRRVSADTPTLPMKRVMRTRSVDAVVEHSALKVNKKDKYKGDMEEYVLTETAQPAPLRRSTRIKSTPEPEIDLLAQRRLTRSQLKMLSANESLVHRSPNETVGEDANASILLSSGMANKRAKSRQRKLKTVSEHDFHNTSGRSLRSNMSIISEEHNVEPRRVTRSRRATTD